MGAFAGLSVGLQAVVELTQQIANDIVADTMPHHPERFGQIAQAAAGPQQWRLRVAPCRRFHQAAQVGQQSRIGRCQFLAPTPRTAHPPRCIADARIGHQFGQTTNDGAARHTRNP